MSLTLAEVEAFDPGGGKGTGNVRYCCPLCNEGRTMNDEHRTLAVKDDGVWQCFRCNETGRFKDGTCANAQVDRGTGNFPHPGRPSAKLTEGSKKPYDFEKVLAGFSTEPKKNGREYLKGRGLGTEGVLFGNRYHAKDKADREAVAFPTVNAQGETVGLAVVFLDGTKRTYKRGERQNGVYATPGAMESVKVAVVESAIDALSLALAGLPSIATIGTSVPEWVGKRLALKTVYVSHDADKAGDDAAKKVSERCQKFGATVQRWRPEGHKDWNDVLVKGGLEALRQSLLENGMAEPSETGKLDAMIGCAERIVVGAKQKHDRELESLARAVIVKCEGCKGAIQGGGRDSWFRDNGHAAFGAVNACCARVRDRYRFLVGSSLEAAGREILCADQ